MEREQMDEHQTIQEAVYAGLRSGQFMDRHRAEQTLQYLVLPAFENAISWDLVSVHSRTHGDQTRLYRSCWRADLDMVALSSPVERMKHPRPFQPTMEVDWVLLKSVRVEELMVRYRSIRIPLAVAEPTMGLDGVNFELSFGEFFCNARIGWWSELPVEWLELQPVLFDTIQLFEEAWKTRADQGLSDT